MKTLTYPELTIHLTYSELNIHQKINIRVCFGVSGLPYYSKWFFNTTFTESFVNSLYY